MKAITVRQPWAWAIIYGGKDVEKYRGALGLWELPDHLLRGVR